MRESPNKDNPQADIEFIIEELLSRFTDADEGRGSWMTLDSQVGSTFHSRVLNAAAHLGLVKR